MGNLVSQDELSDDLGYSMSYADSTIINSGNLGKKMIEPPFKGGMVRERAYTAVNKTSSYIKSPDNQIEEDDNEDHVDDSNEKKEKFAKQNTQQDILKQTSFTTHQRVNSNSLLQKQDSLNERVTEDDDEEDYEKDEFE